MRATVVIVPVKSPRRGKSRLVGVSAQRREALAAGFALDTVVAALAARSAVQVLVVTDDAAFAGRFVGLGAHVLPDGTDDLNGSLVQAAAEAARRWPELTPVVVCADLPALLPATLDAVLAALPEGPAFVPDVDGTGTTLYSPGSGAFRPAFGAGSAQAHQDAGAVRLDETRPGLEGVDLRTLRRDVDSPDDLAEVLGLGVGPHTAAAVASA